MKNTPKHIVIVPDGNRRWAREKNLPPQMGHLEGVKAFEKVGKKANELNIPYFTAWGCSVSNVTARPQKEIDTLMNIFEKQFTKIAKDKETHQNQVKIRVLGRWAELFTPKAKKAVEKAIEATKNYRQKNITFLLAYSGVDEVVSAVSAICRKRKANPNLEITPTVIKNNLWTRELPPVDLVIRTGGEPHWSAGLMMFDVAEARLYFTNTLWPDFSPQEFEKAVAQYAQAERRFGR
ncbi:MAG: polyprenyl diphosphate synthase [bacterium]